MKKLSFFIIFVLLGAVALAQTNTNQTELQQQEQATIQWISIVKESCNPCIEGEKSQFSLAINNVGNIEFAIRSISLVDSAGFIFASSNVDTIVPTNSTKSFSIDSTIPPPTRGKTLYYKSCFVLSSRDQTAESCENSFRRLSIQDNVEVSLVIIYMLLSIILIVMTAFFLLFLRKIDSKKR